MAWRVLIGISMWLAYWSSASQAGIIFHRNKPNQPDQTAGLLQTLRSDGDERHRVAAAEALGRLDPNSNSGIVPTLEEAARNDSSNAVRNAALSTLNHYSKAGHRLPASLTQTAEPPMAAPPSSPAPPKVSPPPSSATRPPANTPSVPRVTSRPTTRESTEPPLAGSQPQSISTPATQSTPPVIARSPAAPSPAVTGPKPMAIKAGSTAINPPTPTTPATTSTPLPSTPATTITPKLANPAAQAPPTVRPPVIASTPSDSPAPAAKAKTVPAKPDDDGPVLNPPG
ncbi:MAG TPA: HEAT repeat domain-containing protein [Gemmataceae bacterium]|nr:HEAT repeat domain-containing protein [Gemmataceae bacterium]